MHLAFGHADTLGHLVLDDLIMESPSRSASPAATSLPRVAISRVIAITAIESSP